MIAEVPTMKNPHPRFLPLALACLILLVLLITPAFLVCSERREVPISATRDGILLASVEIQGRTRAFIVDTGGMTTLNSNLGLPKTTKRHMKATTALGSSVREGTYALVTINLGNGYAVTLEVLTRDMKAIEEFVGQPIGGILGYDILRDWTRITVDKEKGKLILER